mgnify:CR=1 FL=1
MFDPVLAEANSIADADARREKMRRLEEIMQEEGVMFKNNVNVGVDVPMKKMKKVVKRDIYKTGSARDKAQEDSVSEREDPSDCSGTAVVHCNQWECFTRVLCRKKESDTEPVGSI